MQVGDTVKPVDTFDFERFSGPENLDDRGVVVSVEDSVFFEGDDVVMVRWAATGHLTDHPGNDSANPEMQTLFGIELVTEEADAE